MNMKIRGFERLCWERSCESERDKETSGVNLSRYSSPILVHGDKSVSSLNVEKENKWEMHLKHLVRNEVEQSPVKNRIQKANEERRPVTRGPVMSKLYGSTGGFLGCHHSKYALMFCENHLRIAITTQNLVGGGYVTDVTCRSLVSLWQQDVEK